jgi:hypothetical protein
MYAPPAPPASASSLPPALEDDAIASQRFTRDTSSSSSVSRPVAKGAESVPGAVAGSTVTATSTSPQGQTLQGGVGAAQTSDGTNRGALSQSYASGQASWTAVAVVAGYGLTADESLAVVAVALCA